MIEINREIEKQEIENKERYMNLEKNIKKGRIFTQKGQPFHIEKLEDYFFAEKRKYLPWFSSRFLEFLAMQFKEYIDYKFSCEIIITGQRRAGKSTLAMQIARLIDSTFPQENIVFEIEDFAKRYEENPIGGNGYYPQIILDEAGYDLFSQRWYDEIQKEMVKLFEVSAAKYHIIYLVAPHLGVLNKQIKNFGSFWINIETENLNRGVAEFWKPKIDKFQGIPWYSPICAFNFDALEDDFWEQYQNRKREFIKNAIEKFGRPSKQLADKLISKTLANMLKRKYNVSVDEMARNCGVSTTTIYKILNFNPYEF